jgi:hypothetical protein
MSENPLWKCLSCEDTFTDKQLDSVDGDRCPLCFMAFSQMPYEPPHATTDYVRSDPNGALIDALKQSESVLAIAASYVTTEQKAVQRVLELVRGIIEAHEQ